MSRVYYEPECNVALLKEKKIAVLGYGSQGHAHAQNLRDSGCNVKVAVGRERSSEAKARKDGFITDEIKPAVKWADLIVVLLPDEVQEGIYKEHILPGLKGGKMLLFAHGFSIHFSLIKTAADIDVALVAPKGPGHMVRREYECGRGVPGLVAVHQNNSGRCLDLALAYGAALGLARAGLILTSFQEETETDLFGEQAVLCGGLCALMRMGFETLTMNGYQPEMAYFECIHEMKLIVDMIYEGGFSWMRYSISNTAEYGDYLTQAKMSDSGIAETMKQILEDIRSGEFARKWMREQETGSSTFLTLRQRYGNHELEKVGRRMRSMMPWLGARVQEIRGLEKNEK